MSKRFTDTEKWKKESFRKLGTVHKLFFLYLLDNCDHAGIWDVELDVAEIRIGAKINIKSIITDLKDYIHVFDNGKKWFIPAFIKFQYGKLNPMVHVHKSAWDILEKRNLIKVYEQFMNGAQTVQEELPLTVMDEDINKDNIIETKNKNFVKPTIEEIADYCVERKNTVDPDMFFNFYESKGWKIGNNPMKDWQAAVRTWERKHNNNPSTQQISKFKDEDLN